MIDTFSELVNSIIDKYKPYFQQHVDINLKGSEIYEENLANSIKKDFMEKNYPVDYEDYLKALEEEYFTNKLNQYFRFFIEIYRTKEIDDNTFLKLLDHETIYKNDRNKIYLAKASLYNKNYAILTKLNNERFNYNIVYNCPFLFNYAVKEDETDMDTKIANLHTIFDGLNQEDKDKFLNKIAQTHDPEKEMEAKLYFNLKIRNKLPEKISIKEKVKKI